jgi:hypothetical protein
MTRKHQWVNSSEAFQGNVHNYDPYKQKTGAYGYKIQHLKHSERQDSTQCVKLTPALLILHMQLGRCIKIHISGAFASLSSLLKHCVFWHNWPPSVSHVVEETATPFDRC